MSADNGIYVAHFPDGWRFCYAQAIENLFYYRETDLRKFKIDLKLYFSTSEVFSKRSDCLMSAHDAAKQYDILEYGVCELGELPQFT